VYYHNKQLLPPLRGWDGLSVASQLQDRPKAGRYVNIRLSAKK